MDAAKRKLLNERVEAIVFDLLDVNKSIAKKIAAAVRPQPTPPAGDTRRQVANVLRLSQHCDRKACRRAHCCRGEPLHCLRIAIPLLPVDAFAGLLRAKRKPRGKTSAAAPSRPSHVGLTP